MLFKRGNGYYEGERGKFDAFLLYEDSYGEYSAIAHTDRDVVIAYNDLHREEIEEWADEYGYEIEWR